MTLEQMQAFIKRVAFRNYRFEVTAKNGVPFLQAAFEAPCIVTGKQETQRSRKWMLSEHMTPSEIVQTALKCVLTSVEHEAREDFHFNGKAIFGPHLDIEALLALAEHTDVRKEHVA